MRCFAHLQSCSNGCPSNILSGECQCSCYSAVKFKYNSWTPRSVLHFYLSDMFDTYLILPFCFFLSDMFETWNYNNNTALPRQKGPKWNAATVVNLMFNIIMANDALNSSQYVTQKCHLGPVVMVGQNSVLDCCIYSIYKFKSRHSVKCPYWK